MSKKKRFDLKTYQDNPEIAQEVEATLEDIVNRISLDYQVAEEDIEKLLSEIIQPKK